MEGHLIAKDRSTISRLTRTRIYNTLCLRILIINNIVTDGRALDCEGTLEHLTPVPVRLRRVVVRRVASAEIDDTHLHTKSRIEGALCA